MCIIIAKYRGNKLPSKKTLENCFYNNNDGAGIAYTKHGEVYIDKGYNKFDEFYKRLKELDKKYNLKEENVLLHFRIGTSGNMDATATHPFPISDKVKKLQAPQLSNLTAAVAHNGVISDYAYKNDEGLSDTQNFIKDFLAPLQDLNNYFYKRKNIQQLIRKTISSKLAIIDKNDITLIGDFEQGSDGNWYSNQSYKSDYFKASKNKYYSDYSSFDYDWKDYNWRDYNYYTSNSIYHKKTSDLMELDDKCYILEQGKELEDIYNVDEYYYIDKDYNLYNLIDYYQSNYDGEWYYKLERIAPAVEVLDEDLKPIQFNANIVLEDEDNESEVKPIE